MGKNKIGKLEGVPDVERVIDGEQTKLFRVTSIVLSRTVLDEVIDEYELQDATLDLNGPVKVYGFDGKQAVGFANFHWQGEHLFSYVTIDYSCEERLVLQVGEEPIWLDMDLGLSSTGVLSIDQAFLVTKRPNHDDCETPLSGMGNS